MQWPTIEQQNQPYMDIGSLFADYINRQIPCQLTKYHALDMRHIRPIMWALTVVPLTVVHLSECNQAAVKLIM